MGYLKYLREAWKNPSPEHAALQRTRLIEWRQEPVTVRIAHPTRIDRARSLGYKAKNGIFLVRQRVNRGGRMRPKITGGRKPRKFRRMATIGKSYQWIAEERAVQGYPNCEVLNSYFVAKDGKHYWYEIILVDRAHPEVLADPALRWIAKPQHMRRVHRGLSAAGKRSRGILTHKGKGAEKLRPSLRAHSGKAK